jgi:hypothetical protein
VYVISPINFLVFVGFGLAGGNNEREKNLSDFLEFGGNNPSIPPTLSEWRCPDLC